MNKLERIIGIVGISARLLSYPIGLIAATNILEYDAVKDELNELGDNYSCICEEVTKDYREKRNQEGFSLNKWGSDFAIDEYLDECISAHNVGVI